MKLREWDWDRQRFVEVDYPDGPIAEFVDFFRTTKAWENDGARVMRKVRALEQALAAHRELVQQEAQAARAATAAEMTAPPAKPKAKGGRRAAHAEGG